MANLKFKGRLRSLPWIINIILLIALIVFAKDDIVSQLKYRFSSEALVQSTAVSASGTIEVAFSPNKGATQAITKALAEARSSILVSAYSFTSKDIAKALLDAKQRNLEVKIILDKSQVSQRYSASTFFSNLGFDLRIDVKHAIYHNKVMIIDNVTVITGSFNFTKAAETRNAENVLIIRNNPQLAHLYADNWRFHWKQSISFDEFKKKFPSKKRDEKNDEPFLDTERNHNDNPGEI